MMCFGGMDNELLFSFMFFEVLVFIIKGFLIFLWDELSNCNKGFRVFLFVVFKIV